MVHLMCAAALGSRSLKLSFRHVVYGAPIERMAPKDAHPKRRPALARLTEACFAVPCSPAAGPCTTTEWACCPFKCGGCAPYNATACHAGTNGHPEICNNACNAALDTPFRMGGIHPRSKKQVGDRLGNAYVTDGMMAGGLVVFVSRVGR